MLSLAVTALRVTRETSDWMMYLWALNISPIVKCCIVKHVLAGTLGARMDFETIYGIGFCIAFVWCFVDKDFSGGKLQIKLILSFGFALIPWFTVPFLIWEKFFSKRPR